VDIALTASVTFNAKVKMHHDALPLQLLEFSFPESKPARPAYTITIATICHSCDTVCLGLDALNACLTMNVIKLLTNVILKLIAAKAAL
jgi:hypothetical protein